MKRFKKFLKEDPDRFLINTNKNITDGQSSLMGEYGDKDCRVFGFIGNIFLMGNGKHDTHFNLMSDYFRIIMSKKDIDKEIEKSLEIILKTAKNNIKNYKGTGFIKEIEYYKSFLELYNHYKSTKNLNPIKKLIYKTINYNVGGLPTPDRLAMIMPGRLWFDKKVISFWIYPQSIKEINKLISALSKEGIKIDDDWWIDLSRLDRKDFTGINYKEYKSSKEIKSADHDLSKIHMMSPEQKKKLMSKVRGFGSDKEAAAAKEAGFDTAAEWRAKTIIGDCMSLGKFKEILNEKI